MVKNNEQKEPLTEDTIIGSRKISAVEFRKFFKKALGNDYDKYPIVDGVIKMSSNYKGRTLIEIIEGCFSQSKQEELQGHELTQLHVQQKLKPDIEDVIPYYLDGKELETALNFIAHLRTEKIKPRWAGVHSTWNFNYKGGKTICFIRLGRTWHAKESGKIKWEVSPNLINISAYENEIIDKNMQNYIWDGLVYCKSCIRANGLHQECSPGVNKIVLKKDVTGICRGFFGFRKPISFQNPDEAALNCIKKLIELEKQARISK